MTSPYPTMAESRAISSLDTLARSQWIADQIRKYSEDPYIVAAYRNAADPYARKDH